MRTAFQPRAIISPKDFRDGGVFMNGEVFVAGKDGVEVFGGGEGIGGVGSDGGAHPGVITRHDHDEMGVGEGVGGPGGVGAGDGIIRLGGHGAAEIRVVVHRNPEIGKSFSSNPPGAIDRQGHITDRDGRNAFADEVGA